MRLKCASQGLTAHCNPPALGQVVGGMLSTVPAERRGQVRDYLEALSVLRSFDEERIPRMLAAYYDDEIYIEWPYAQARQVRGELVKLSFAQWDAERGGYVLDESTRHLLERYLETTQPDRWQRLHWEQDSRRRIQEQGYQLQTSGQTGEATECRSGRVIGVE